MSPFQGSGAGQAIEDVYVLATLLGHNHATIDNLPRVLAAYDSLRQPFAQDVARRSDLSGRYFTLNHEAFGFDTDVDDELQKLREMGDAIVENWKWAWSTSIDETIEWGVRTQKRDGR